MKKYLYLLFAAFVAVEMSACSPDDNGPDSPETEIPDTPNTPDNPDDGNDPDKPSNPDKPNPVPEGKTLIVYYSFTNNVHTIVSDLQTQIEADVIRVEPAEEGLDYAANNYAIGSALIQAIRNNPNDAASYPEIKPVEVDIADYDRIIVGVPLWWSNMAAPMQTFLFKYGSRMTGKSIGLIVSSASSGISGVEADARRLIPEGNFLSPSLWIRSSQTPNCHSIIASWLEQLNINNNNDNNEEDMNTNSLKLTVGGKTFTATLVENSSTEALKKRLEQSPLSVQMSDYGDMEKVGTLGLSLPRNDQQTTTAPGDLILYQGNSLVIYYDSNSWNFTRLGKVDGVSTREEMLELLGGKGDVTVTLSL